MKKETKYKIAIGLMALIIVGYVGFVLYQGQIANAYNQGINDLAIDQSNNLYTKIAGVVNNVTQYQNVPFATLCEGVK